MEANGGGWLAVEGKKIKKVKGKKNIKKNEKEPAARMRRGVGSRIEALPARTMSIYGTKNIESAVEESRERRMERRKLERGLN